MAFDARIQRGEQFEEELMELLSGNPNVVSVCQNGTEHTHPAFVSLLRDNNSPAAKMVRYAPDGVVLLKTKEVVHFDAKCAKSIEKDAYESYLGLTTIGCTVLLFVKHEGVIYWQDITKLTLIPGSTTVAPFPEHRRLPVGDDGWIYPRRNRPRMSGDMSGTPYREIDFSSMLRLKTTN